MATTVAGSPSVTDQSSGKAQQQNGSGGEVEAMEMQLVASQGIPSTCLLAIRVGPGSSQQFVLSEGQVYNFFVPKMTPELRLEKPPTARFSVYLPLAHARLLMEPGETQFTLPLETATAPSSGAEEMSVSLEVLRPNDATKNGEAEHGPSETVGAASPDKLGAAGDDDRMGLWAHLVPADVVPYFKQHHLLGVLTALLQGVIREQPDDLRGFLTRMLRNSQQAGSGRRGGEVGAASAPSRQSNSKYSLRISSISGVPEGAILSVRVGKSRQQALAKIGQVFDFAGLHSLDHMKITVLSLLAHRRATVSTDADKKMAVALEPLPGKTFPDGPMSVTVGVSYGDAPAADSPEAETVPLKSPARKPRHRKALDVEPYFQKHGVLDLLQDLLQALMKQQPEKPFELMIEVLQQGGSQAQQVGNRQPDPAVGTTSMQSRGGAVDIVPFGAYYAQHLRLCPEDYWQSIHSKYAVQQSLPKEAALPTAMPAAGAASAPEDKQAAQGALQAALASTDEDVQALRQTAQEAMQSSLVGTEERKEVAQGALQVALVSTEEDVQALRQTAQEALQGTLPDDEEKEVAQGALQVALVSTEEDVQALRQTAQEALQGTLPGDEEKEVVQGALEAALVSTEDDVQALRESAQEALQGTLLGGEEDSQVTVPPQPGPAQAPPKENVNQDTFGKYYSKHMLSACSPACWQGIHASFTSAPSVPVMVASGQAEKAPAPQQQEAPAPQQQEAPALQQQEAPEPQQEKAPPPQQQEAPAPQQQVESPQKEQQQEQLQQQQQQSVEQVQPIQQEEPSQQQLTGSQEAFRPSIGTWSSTRLPTLQRAQRPRRASGLAKLAIIEDPPPPHPFLPSVGSWFTQRPVPLVKAERRSSLCGQMPALDPSVVVVDNRVSAPVPRASDERRSLTTAVARMAFEGAVHITRGRQWRFSRVGEEERFSATKYSLRLLYTHASRVVQNDDRDVKVAVPEEERNSGIRIVELKIATAEKTPSEVTAASAERSSSRKGSSPHCRKAFQCSEIELLAQSQEILSNAELQSKKEETELQVWFHEARSALDKDMQKKLASEERIDPEALEEAMVISECDVQEEFCTRMAAMADKRREAAREAKHLLHEIGTHTKGEVLARAQRLLQDAEMKINGQEQELQKWLADSNEKLEAEVVAKSREINRSKGVTTIDDTGGEEVPTELERWMVKAQCDLEDEACSRMAAMAEERREAVRRARGLLRLWHYYDNPLSPTSP